MNTFAIATLAAALISLASKSAAESDVVRPKAQKVTVTAVDSKGFLSFTGDGFRGTVDAHMAEIRFRKPTGRTTKKSLADIQPGMTGTVTAYWGVGSLATKIVIHTK